VVELDELLVEYLEVVVLLVGVETVVDVCDNAVEGLDLLVGGGLLLVEHPFEVEPFLLVLLHGEDGLLLALE